MKKKRKRVVKRITTETVDHKGDLKTVIKEHSAEEHRKKRKASGEKRMTAKEREELLIENFVGLQHAMTNMSIKFGGLADNISKLLEIFEESAKNFVSGGKPDDAEMLTKIDSLLNQNKTIAKGLVLMEGKLRGRNESMMPANVAPMGVAPVSLMPANVAPVDVPPRMSMPPRMNAPSSSRKPLPSL